MSQTTQQEQDATPAKPGTRKDWEWFWRIIAALMLLIIAWVAWVLYQISPRSVVTPLAYMTPVRPIGAQQLPGGVAAPAAPQQAPEAAAAADPAIAPAQAAARSADQAAADVQPPAQEKKEEPIKREGLRLATEISTPPAEKHRTPKSAEGKPESAPAAPAATGAAGKDRP